MKTILKLSIVALLFVTIITGCKKYEDGPAFSLLSKKSRLTGDWVVNSVTVDGNDVTSAFKAAAGANYVLAIEKDGAYHVHGTFPDNGTWKLGEDKDDVYFTSSTAGSTEQAFRILRLKSKELWLKSTATNGVVTIIHYDAEKD